MTPEHKFATAARLCQEVLGGVADGALPLEEAGEVLADAGIDVGVISATIDPAQVKDARAKIPAWKTNAAF